MTIRIIFHDNEGKPVAEMPFQPLPPDPSFDERARQVEELEQEALRDYERMTGHPWPWPKDDVGNEWRR